MLEKDLWTKIRDDRSNLDVFFQRVESSTADGIPDLYIHSRKWGGWCELKYLQETKTGRYNLSLKKYTMVQREWSAAHTRAGGITMLCVGIGDQVFWLMGKKSVTIVKFNIEEIAKWAFHKSAIVPKTIRINN